MRSCRIQQMKCSPIARGSLMLRPEWTDTATGHLLNEDNNANMDKPPETILHILKEKVCALYKAILLFQMKSVCYYYRKQINNLFRQLGKIDDWDGARQAVVDAEKAFLKDWKRYKKVQA